MDRVDHPVPDPGFRADLGSAFRVLRARPLLPLMSVAVWALPTLVPPALFFLALPVSIFSIGYPGTERLWILKGFRGLPFTFEEALSRTGWYIGRFFRLGLLLIPIGVAGVVLGWVVDRSFTGVIVGAAVASLLLDFGLTFVTPALALSTKRVREALRLGLRMVRYEWPANALYVLVPPLAIILIAQLIPGLITARHIAHARPGGRIQPVPESLRLVSSGIAAVAALVGLIFKGATVAFYGRRFEVGPDGAR
jgi:hypothetical protein